MHSNISMSQQTLTACWGGGYIALLISSVPGVPAFFFISGYLISASWERLPQPKTFFINRFLRIFPGLWIASLLATVTLLAYGPTTAIGQNLRMFMLWLFAQSTIFQAWNPGFLRGFGVGVVNGSLWTIAVEISFYVFIPILYLIFRRTERSTIVLVTIIASSFTLQYFLYALPEAQSATMHVKMLKASPLPWVGMFCFGVLAQRHSAAIISLVAGRALYFLCFYVGVALVSHAGPWPPLLRGASNSMGLVNYVAMVGLLLSIAFTNVGLSERLLRRNDISYGMYIFHMPIVNVLVENGVMGWNAFALAMLGTTTMALLSWNFVERPALRLRKAALFSR